jgi:DNA adenine methylase
MNERAINAHGTDERRRPMKITAIAPWFGSNRMLAPHVGEALGRLAWCGVPFAGGMCELPYIQARTILVNDLHRHVINLARVCADDKLRPQLIRWLRRRAFHPDELAEAASICSQAEPDGIDLELARRYFVCAWMGRSHKAGTSGNPSGGEFFGEPALRWNANGGDSAVRYHSAIRMLGQFAKTLRRCTFTTNDAFEMLARCEDSDGHGIYCDPPFLEKGRSYKFNCGESPVEEKTWHRRLAESLNRFQKTKVVCRFYEHPLIREFYEGWTFKELAGRTQANEKASELLVTNQRLEQETPMMFA